MSTKNEVKDEKKKVESQVLETSSQKPMPSIVVVTNDKTAVSTSRQVSHFDKVDKTLSHNGYHKGHAYRPDVKACTFKVSRHDSHRKVVAKAENMKGVMDTKWNPRTREVTVIYDAKVTSARHIRHFMA